MNSVDLRRKLEELRALPTETEWVEFKHNNSDPQEIGEYISALANGAALHDKANGYLVWGVKDDNHEIIGTSVRPKQQMVGNNELENWLHQMLEPRIDFRFNEPFDVDGKTIVILEIPAAASHPVRFRKKHTFESAASREGCMTFPRKSGSSGIFVRTGRRRL